jgi:uncharacterized protein YegL
MALANIQNRLDDLEPDGTLTLEKGDYAPCVISKPVTLLCDGSTFWTDGSAPAMVIRCPNVTIKDANLCCIADSEHKVFSVEANCHPLLQNVRISGLATGVEPEPADWILPPSINTGDISPQTPGFFLELAVPQRAQIVCRISGVSMDPSALGPGINTVKLQIRDAMPDSMLIGEIEIIGGVLTRLIPFFARISTNASSSQDGATPTLFGISPAEKERFQKLLAGESSKTKVQPSAIPKQAKTEATAPTNEKPGRRKPKTIQAPTAIQPTPISWEAQKSSVTIPAPADETSKLGGAFAATTHQRRLPVYILVDCSLTLAGDPIESMKAGISALHSELMNDPSAVESAWMSVITFDQEARQIVPLTELHSFTPPDLHVAEGRVLGAALKLLSQSIDSEVIKQSANEKGDWKPIIFILTDGSPTDRWQEAAADLKSKFRPNIIAVACGDGADINVLKSITDTVLEMKNMSPSDFSAFFKWTTEALPDSEVILNPQPKAVPTASATSIPALGKLFQSSMNVTQKSESIASLEPAIPFKPGSLMAKTQSPSHLSKLFTDDQ